MDEELYQNHGDHIEAIMPTSDFMKNHLKSMISESKVLKTVESDVSLEPNNKEKTNVTSLYYGNNDIGMQTILAYSKEENANILISCFPCMSGIKLNATIKKIIEWDNLLEATILCSVGNFEFAFFSTDYYINKKVYKVGNTFLFEISALGCKVNEAPRGFSFEGEKALNWYEKNGEDPEYDDDGNVKPISFNTEKLVAFLNTDKKCPDEAQFQSPVENVKVTSIFDIDFKKTNIIMSRGEEGNDIKIPLYFRSDFFPNVKNNDPIQGWLWVTGRLSEVNDNLKVNNDNKVEKDIPITNIFTDIGKDFVKAVNNFNFKHFDDVMGMIKPLNKITVKEGFVIDAFKNGDRLGSVMQLYACKCNSQIKYNPQIKEVPIYKTKNVFFIKKKIQTGIKKVFSHYEDDMYISGMLDNEVAEQIPSVFKYINVPFTEIGIWQAYLLNIAPTIMPQEWHGAYLDKQYIFDLDDLKNLEGDCSKYYKDDSLLPNVKILDAENAIITITTWNDWRGLCKETIHVTPQMLFKQEKFEVLVEYDCGIRF